ncbi:hypothetical protein ARMGADRAFT_1040592 [Armillaria gallica]|uniref:Uncharacterized protein n=1 Tax=Armillaria gallica TaxID=47427 RepID=A0A2H3CWQ4_ARMGA|nr:hypothetical protein ARMGADRAFT_1040592 [Armillaria gallica]
MCWPSLGSKPWLGLGFHWLGLIRTSSPAQAVRYGSTQAGLGLNPGFLVVVEILLLGNVAWILHHYYASEKPGAQGWLKALKTPSWALSPRRPLLRPGTAWAFMGLACGRPGLEPEPAHQ